MQALPANVLELELALNEVTAEGARALSQALSRLPRLQRLSLQENELENEGAIALARGLNKLKDLRELHLSQNQVLWHFLHQIRPACMLPYLERAQHAVLTMRQVFPTWQTPLLLQASLAMCWSARRQDM